MWNKTNASTVEKVEVSKLKLRFVGPITSQMLAWNGSQTGKTCSNDEEVLIVSSKISHCRRNTFKKSEVTIGVSWLWFGYKDKKDACPYTETFQKNANRPRKKFFVKRAIPLIPIG